MHRCGEELPGLLLMKASKLEIKDLYASIDGKQILKGVNLTITKGEIHALMGPNGSGKSTLSAVLLGHPKYKVDSGDILLDGESVLTMKTDERAKRGLFLALQYPMQIAGVNYLTFLFTAAKAQRDEPKLSLLNFRKEVLEKLKAIELTPTFLERYLNQGFSGGEKKRAEILQMMVFNPSLAVLDETDSGLDVDSLKIVSKAINTMHGQDFGCLLITHYHRILNHIKPDIVHVMVDGKIVATGDQSLAEEIEHKGYQAMQKAAI